MVGIRANAPRIAHLVNESLMLVTALNPYIGYDKAAHAAKNAHKLVRPVLSLPVTGTALTRLIPLLWQGISLKQSVLDLGYLDADTFDRVVRAEQMISPEHYAAPNK